MGKKEEIREEDVYRCAATSIKRKPTLKER